MIVLERKRISDIKEKLNLIIQRKGLERSHTLDKQHEKILTARAEAENHPF